MSESKLQIAMVKWFRLQYPDYVLYAIPNGGNRSAITGAIMKAEGTMAGVADLFLMQANKDFHGLYIEVKTPKGKQSPSQKLFELKAIERGYGYIVVKTFDEFCVNIITYLQNKI
jgi:hypothetical protein